MKLKHQYLLFQIRIHRKPRAAFGFKINLADVFAHDAQRKHLNAAEQQDQQEAGAEAEDMEEGQEEADAVVVADVEEAQLLIARGDEVHRGIEGTLGLSGRAGGEDDVDRIGVDLMLTHKGKLFFVYRS